MCMNRENMNYQKSLIVDEIKKRNAKLDEAKKTEGWLNLSKKQQKIIELSLFIQDRSKREQYLPEKYRESYIFAEEYCCHFAIYSLENNILFKPDILRSKKFLPEIKKKKNFQAEYNIYPNISSINKAMEKTGYPCIMRFVGPSMSTFFDTKNELLEFLNRDNDLDSLWWKYPAVVTHSLLVLGRNKRKTITWSKEGFKRGNPFKIDILENDCREHTHINVDKRFFVLGLKKIENKKD